MAAQKPSRTVGIEERKRKGGTVYRAVVFDKTTGRKITRTFQSRQAAKQWRTDAMSALGAGRLSADRGPTLRDAAEQWLDGARDGHVRNRSGDAYKPSAVRGYEQNLRKRVLPELGTTRLGDIRHRDLQALVDRLQKQGIGASTITTTITPLRAIFGER